MCSVPSAVVVGGGSGDGQRQRGRNRSPWRRSRSAIERRPDERVAKTNPAIDGDQPGGFGRRGRSDVDAEALSRRPQPFRTTGGLGRRDEQQRAGRRRKAANPAAERLLDVRLL